MRILIAAVAAIAFASPALATSFGCTTFGDPAWTETIPGEIHQHSKTKKVLTGSTPGKDGWDGIGGQCTKPGSSRVWVGPRNANGTCQTAASLVGTEVGFTYKAVVKTWTTQDPDTVIEHPSTETHQFYVALPHVGKVYVGQTHDGACP